MHAGLTSEFDINSWLTGQFRHAHFALTPITGDASFRHYYRVQLANSSFIVLSAPLDESLLPFLSVRAVLQDIGLSVPMLFSSNEAAGLLMLSDLGSTQYADLITRAQKADQLYRCAFYPLILMQRDLRPDNCPIPLRDFSTEFMLTQLDLFQVWYTNKHLQRYLNEDMAQELSALFKTIVDSVSEQPLVFSHMDYHSRNLMVLNKKHMPGIVDFQDAMWAPCTLDLVSLLKDCYIHWPRTQVVEWVKVFYTLKKTESFGDFSVDFPTFLKWFDWMGVQRHLRILGTFSRLHYLYGKVSYLQYVPRIVADLQEVSTIYPELRALKGFLS